MTFDQTLNTDDFRCPVCFRSVEQAPVPEDMPGKMRCMGFACPDPSCPVGLFYVSMGAPEPYDRLVAIQGVCKITHFHLSIAQQQYREQKQKEAETN